MLLPKLTELLDSGPLDPDQQTQHWTGSGKPADQFLDTDAGAGEERRLFPDMPSRIGGAQVAHQVDDAMQFGGLEGEDCLLYTSPSPRDGLLSRMPSSA